MKNVMVRAWEIAKGAVVKFGGKVREYFRQALIMAWKEVKNTKVEFFVRPDARGKKSWVAQITGTHPVYKLSRTFLKEEGMCMLGKVFELENGYYQFDNTRERGYVVVENGKWTDVTYAEVMKAFA